MLDLSKNFNFNVQQQCKLIEDDLQKWSQPKWKQVIIKHYNVTRISYAKYLDFEEMVESIYKAS